MSDNIQQFRDLVYKGVARALELYGHCKSYEGAIDIHYPGYHHKDGKGDYYVELHCYVLGPSRHYTWWGDSVDDALSKATVDVQKWILEMEEAA